MKIIIGGDFYIPEDKTDLATRDPQKTWGQTLNLFQNADFSIINLEGPITNSNAPIHKTGPLLKMSPEIIDLIKFVRINIVTMANNHINDYGDEGVSDSLIYCQDQDISTIGAGLNIQDARLIKYIVKENIKIAIINIAENEWNGATNDHAGSNPMDIIENVKSIHEAKKNADYVILIIHGGHELLKYPSPRIVKQYRFYAEQGVSAIISHHSHYFGGFEVYEGVPIFYGLGNLIMPIRAGDKQWNTGILVQFEIKKKHLIDFQYIPYRFSDSEFTLNFLTGQELVDFDNEIHLTNSVITNEKLLAEKFTEEAQKKEEYFLTSIYLRSIFRNKLIYKILKIIKLTDFFYENSQISNLLNYVRNESHRDVLIDVLSRRIYEQNSHT